MSEDVNDLAKEFAKAVRANQKSAKEREIAEIREKIKNAPVSEFEGVKRYMLILFDQNIFFQSMIDSLMKEKLLGFIEEA